MERLTYISFCYWTNISKVFENPRNFLRKSGDKKKYIILKNGQVFNEISHFKFLNGLLDILMFCLDMLLEQVLPIGRVIAVLDIALQSQPNC